MTWLVYVAGWTPAVGKTPAGQPIYRSECWPYPWDGNDAPAGVVDWTPTAPEEGVILDVLAAPRPPYLPRVGDDVRAVVAEGPSSGDPPGGPPGPWADSSSARFDDPFALAADSYARPERAATPDGAPGRILFIGDSLSVGTAKAMFTVSQELGIPTPTIELPGTPGGRRAVQVTPATARAWFDAAKPTAVWIALGTNDLAGSPADMGAGWKALAALIRDARTWPGVDRGPGKTPALVVGSVPPLRDREPQAAAWSHDVEALAAELGIPLARIWESVKLSDLPDGVHPKDYRPLARAWMNAGDAEGIGGGTYTPKVAPSSGSGGGAVLAIGAALALLFGSKGNR